MSVTALIVTAAVVLVAFRPGTTVTPAGFSASEYVWPRSTLRNSRARPSAPRVAKSGLAALRPERRRRLHVSGYANSACEVSNVGPTSPTAITERSFVAVSLMAEIPLPFSYAKGSRVPTCAMAGSAIVVMR